MRSALRSPLAWALAGVLLSGPALAADTTTFNVTLVVTNAIGCTDTIVIGTIEVFDNTPPAAPPIYMVTVLDNVSDSISWQSYQGDDFSHYVLYWAQPFGSNNYVPLDSFFNVNDTT